VPVWHDLTRQLVNDDRLVVLGVTQEQHAARCRLFAQWKRFGWPILHDPINVLESSAVPIVVAVDEQGVVRSTRPRPESLEKEFVDRTFDDDATAGATPERYGPVHPPLFGALQSAARASNSADDWRSFGDSLILWGGPKRLNDAIDAYTAATRADPRDRRAFFRLGVALRQRYDSAARQRDDFQAAVENWGRALALDPNQYIWRRRIQQYGPRLDKPYPFYDWVPEAERAIRERGESPVELPVRPDGAEIAKPAKGFGAPRAATEPDPAGEVARIEHGRVTAEITVVPRAVAPGQTARIHVVCRVDSQSGRVHWNNEADPLRLWLDPPNDWVVSQRLLSAPLPEPAVSEENRRIEFEVKAPATASAMGTISGYALFHVCDDAGGACRFARLDVTVEVPVAVPVGRRQAKSAPPSKNASQGR
jgi:hypothetical protein